MGWTTVITINNDNLDILQGDPNFGRNLIAAVNSSFGKKEVKVPASDGKKSGIGAVVVVQYRKGDENAKLVLPGGHTIEIL